MPFTVSWTTSLGSKNFQLKSAQDVLDLYESQNLLGAMKVVIKDDRGQKLQIGDIAILAASQGD